MKIRTTCSISSSQMKTQMIYRIMTNAKTHVAQFLHMCHQQGEAMSKGRIILCADLFDK